MSDLLKMLHEMAKDNPALRAKLMSATGFDKAQDAREKMKAFCDGLMGDGFEIEHVMFALTTQLALVSYVAKRGNRAEARDMVGAALDSAYDATDEGARKNGLYDSLKAFDAAYERGDKAEVDRMIANVKGSDTKFEF